MNFDFSTFIGVLGVVLTVLFFVVGYRQTIGARKERALSANKHLSEALFRRFVIDEEFPIDLTGISKLVMGSALGAKVRIEDLYNPEQLEAVLFAKIVESDYLPDNRRAEVMGKLSLCFTREERQVYISSTVTSSPVIGSEVRLALVSALTAGSLSVAVAAFYSFRADNSFFMEMTTSTAVGAIAAMAGLLTTTAAILAVYTKLRENSTSTVEPTLSAQNAAEYERNVMQSLSNRGIRLIPSDNPDYDFRIEGPEGDVGIEIKYDINEMSLSKIKSKFAVLEKLCETGHLTKAIIVSSRSPRREIRSLVSKNVIVMHRFRLIDYLLGERDLRVVPPAQQHGGDSEAAKDAI